MGAKIPPLVTPFALVSLVLALGATNVVVNKATHTSEGAPLCRRARMWMPDRCGICRSGRIDARPQVRGALRWPPRLRCIRVRRSLPVRGSVPPDCRFRRDVLCRLPA